MTINNTNMLTRTKLMFASQSTYSFQVRKQILRFSSIESHEKASELYKVEIGIKHLEEKIKSQGARHVNRRRVKEERKFAPDAARQVSARTLDQKTARAVAAKVRNIFDKNHVILEFDAGPGILSEALLNNGMKKVVALEKEIKFYTKLEEIKKNHEKSFNFLPLSLHTVISLSGQRLSNQLQNTVIHEEGSYAQIIGQVYSWGLLVNIVRQKRTFHGFLWDKPVNLCLILPEPSWEHFLDLRGPNMCLVDRVLFNLCFDHEILLRLEKQELNLQVDKTKGMETEHHDVVLLHARSKQTTGFDILDMVVFLKEFYNHASRHRLVIPSLERWSPTCGEELIRRGLPLFARFSDLSPNQLLEVFLYFRNLPNVQDSGLFD